MMEFDFIDHVSIAQSGESCRNLQKFAQSIYPSAFPDPYEREPFENIMERIKNENDFPRTFAVVARRNQEVIGAQIIDYYRECKTAELIYIAVDAKERGKGYGKELLSEGMHYFKEELLKRDLPVCRVFFEMEDPFILQNHSAMDPYIRLSFFARKGAYRIPINYAQPPLIEGQSWADNLMLCVLPQFSDEKEGIPNVDLKMFLSEFCRGLKISDEDAKRQNIMKSVDDATDKDGMVSYQPLIEYSHFSIPLFSVAWHFKVLQLSEENNLCTVFNSYETDLMKYSYQDSDKHPVKTSYIEMYDDFEVMMPIAYKYTSEGTSHYRISETTSFPVKLSFSRSRSRSKELVNMVIHYEGDGIGEFALIKLITYFGSKQEGYTPSESIRFRRRGSKKIYSCDELLNECVGKNEYDRQHCGITELDVARICDNNSKPIFKSLDEFMNLTTKSLPVEDDWNKVMCGIVLGIMDHQRMNAGEIHDTFKLVNLRQNSFMIISRGHLLKIEYSENPEKVDKIQISPYLLIPSTIVCINELILDCNEERLATDEREKRTSSFYRKSILLSDKIVEISKSLDSDFYQDVFQYESEQTILRVASEQRGHLRRYDYLLRRLDENQIKLDNYRAKHDMTTASIENMLIFVFTVMQVVAAIRQDFIIFSVVTFLSIMMGCIAIYIRRRA